MPLEIRELMIKATVNDQAPATNSASPGNAGADKQAIIAQCVEQVLEILKTKSER
jgi:hypothetical protein